MEKQKHEYSESYGSSIPSSLDVHWQMNRYGNCGTCKQWNVTQLKKKKSICIWVNLNKVDEPRADCTECSKSERERWILYINAYVWNLERWYWWTYSSGDGENRLVGTVWEGERE